MSISIGLCADWGIQHWPSHTERSVQDVLYLILQLFAQQRLWFGYVFMYTCGKWLMANGTAIVGCDNGCKSAIGEHTN